MGCCNSKYTETPGFKTNQVIPEKKDEHSTNKFGSSHRPSDLHNENQGTQTPHRDIFEFYKRGSMASENVSQLFTASSHVKKASPTRKDACTSPLEPFDFGNHRPAEDDNEIHVVRVMEAPSKEQFAAVSKFEEVKQQLYAQIFSDAPMEQESLATKQSVHTIQSMISLPGQVDDIPALPTTSFTATASAVTQQVQPDTTCIQQEQDSDVAALQENAIEPVPENLLPTGPCQVMHIEETTAANGPIASNMPIEKFSSEDKAENAVDGNSEALADPTCQAEPSKEAPFLDFETSGTAEAASMASETDPLEDAGCTEVQANGAKEGQTEAEDVVPITNQAEAAKEPSLVDGRHPDVVEPCNIAHEANSVVEHTDNQVNINCIEESQPEDQKVVPVENQAEDVQQLRLVDGEPPDAAEPCNAAPEADSVVEHTDNQANCVNEGPPAGPKVAPITHQAQAAQEASLIDGKPPDAAEPCNAAPEADSVVEHTDNQASCVSEAQPEGPKVTAIKHQAQTAQEASLIDGEPPDAAEPGSAAPDADSVVEHTDNQANSVNEGQLEDPKVAPITHQAQTAQEASLIDCKPPDAAEPCNAAPEADSVVGHTDNQANSVNEGQLEDPKVAPITHQAQTAQEASLIDGKPPDAAEPCNAAPEANSIVEHTDNQANSVNEGQPEGPKVTAIKHQAQTAQEASLIDGEPPDAAEPGNSAPDADSVVKHTDNQANCVNEGQPEGPKVTPITHQAQTAQEASLIDGEPPDAAQPGNAAPDADFVVEHTDNQTNCVNEGQPEGPKVAPITHQAQTAQEASLIDGEPPDAAEPGNAAPEAEFVVEHTDNQANCVNEGQLEGPNVAPITHQAQTAQEASLIGGEPPDSAEPDNAAPAADSVVEHIDNQANCVNEGQLEGPNVAPITHQAQTAQEASLIDGEPPDSAEPDNAAPAADSVVEHIDNQANCITEGQSQGPKVAPITHQEQTAQEASLIDGEPPDAAEPCNDATEADPVVVDHTEGAMSNRADTAATSTAEKTSSTEEVAVANDNKDHYSDSPGAREKVESQEDGVQTQLSDYWDTLDYDGPVACTCACEDCNERDYFDKEDAFMEPETVIARLTLSDEHVEDVIQMTYEDVSEHSMGSGISREMEEDRYTLHAWESEDEVRQKVYLVTEVLSDDDAEAAEGCQDATCNACSDGEPTRVASCMENLSGFDENCENVAHESLLNSGEGVPEETTTESTEQKHDSE